jgi:hypothetical protein
MPFFQLSEPELRDLAKRYIETLEFWLRRIVEEALVKAGGQNYWDANPPVIKKDIRDRVSARIMQSPDRFPRH